VKLIIEPADGVAPLLAALKSAKKSVEIAIFRFDRRDVETALKAAAERGVKVTALIAFANRGGEQGLRKLELRCLDAGIIVARTSDDLVRYHDKYLLIDRRVLYVLSFNFTHLDIDHSRGFGIVTTHAHWVREAARLFRADCTRTKYAPKTETFIVSPPNARKTLGTFLKRAKTQLLIYDPKISDREMLRILHERAKAGVDIKVIGSVAGHPPFEERKLGSHRLHTRTIIRDRRQAFVGSQSLRTLELDSRRELGLIVQDAKIVRTLIETFESDWTSSGAGKAPGPAKETDVPEAAAARDKIAVEKTASEKVASDKEARKAVQVLTKELNPLAVSVKKAVRKAVAKAGEDVLHDNDVKNTMKKVVKKAVKEAVKEAVQDAQDAHDVKEAKN
jgi:phosphatidylserine/phosphatidylglycerophosphate/cardiolipin synthase-like enzyme